MAFPLLSVKKQHKAIRVTNHPSLTLADRQATNSLTRHALLAFL